ncbi:MAG: class I SAM-dependent methyltransferase [Anaerobutyricum soehngenii]
MPIYLGEKHLTSRYCTMDVNKGPLEKHREHIRAEKLGGKIATRLGNGLAPLEPGETDTVVIAGMGGDLICKILKAKPEFLIEGKELILQPQSEWFKIRRHLKRISLSDRKGMVLKKKMANIMLIIKAEPAMDAATATEAPAAFHSRIYERNSRYTRESDSCEDRNGRNLRTVWQILNRNEKSSLNRIFRERNCQKEQYSSRSETVHKKRYRRYRRTFWKGQRANIVKRQRRYQNCKIEI